MTLTRFRRSKFNAKRTTSGGIRYDSKMEKGTFMWRGEPLGWDTESNPPEICLPERWATVVGNIYEHSHLL